MRIFMATNENAGPFMQGHRSDGDDVPGTGGVLDEEAGAQNEVRAADQARDRAELAALGGLEVAPAGRGRVGLERDDAEGACCGQKVKAATVARRRLES